MMDTYRVVLTCTYPEGRVVAATGPVSKAAALKGFSRFIADGGYGPYSHCSAKVVADQAYVMDRLVRGAL